MPDGLASALKNYYLASPTNKDIMPDGRKRSDVVIGLLVNVVQKHHQRSGELTEGIVKKLLTKSSFHPHGIKVMLDDGTVGRVKEILEDD